VANANIDHMVSLIIFIAALILFIGYFGQTIQTAISYQQHNSLSTKTSDLLDTVLLNPGLPDNWAKRDGAPFGWGLQDPEFSQYKLDSFSVMRLTSGSQSQVYYPKTGTYYSNLTNGGGSCILTPNTKTVNYTTATKLLSINGSYGFQLTLTPTVTVDIQKISTGSPLQFHIDISGTGLVMANANITYNLICVNQDTKQYPSITVATGTTLTGQDGSASLSFAGVNGESRSYALVVYCYVYGLKGVGYYIHQPDTFTASITPLVDSFQSRTATLAHSNSVGSSQYSAYPLLYYNASYMILTEEYNFRRVILDANATGQVQDSSIGTEQSASLTMPDNAGILIVTYKDASKTQTGITISPWGLGALSYPIKFGGDPTGQSWVSNDIRQVTIGGIAYQAQLSIWSTTGGN
jgi:hypothetical protein